MSHLLISAAHKSSGKTTVCIGLCAAYTARSVAVQPFKKGPDYIDPMWLEKASRRPCHNLDFYLMSDREILSTFGHRSQGADLSIIEGNKGLYDGLDIDGSNSNAALAHLLNAPVVLVIDARGMTRGIAPLILGYQEFDKNINIAGVILNNLGGTRHEGKLRTVIEHYTDVPVLGAIQYNSQLEIAERHLGLVPSNEASKADKLITNIGDEIAQQVDLDRLMTIAASAIAILPNDEKKAARDNFTDNIRLGVARDAAFGFYYQGDLEKLEAAGAELLFFDTLNDQRLPEVDALFIGGGFPETHMEQLEANASLRQHIYDKIETGMPVYAECGGLMYLARSIHWRGKSCQMVGAIPGDIMMHEKPQGRGYARIVVRGNGLWGESNSSEIPAHEFHYSSLENLEPGLEYSYKVVRGYGIDGKYDGLIYKNTLASYIHMRDVEANPWTHRFVQFIKSTIRAQNTGPAEIVNKG